MGMFSEMATESTIRGIVIEIAKELKENKGKRKVCAAIKKIGRFALTQFDYGHPDWAKEYDELFKE